MSGHNQLVDVAFKIDGMMFPEVEGRVRLQIKLMYRAGTVDTGVKTIEFQLHPALSELVFDAILAAIHNDSNKPAIMLDS